MSVDESAVRGKREFITFFVGDQDFCMDITLVREIRGWSVVTALPHAPSDVLGVLNLRGAVVPIVDLAARLGLGRIDPGPRHVIIIALVRERTVGFLVDAVSDIVGVSADAVQVMAPFNEASCSEFVGGVITLQDRTLRVLSGDALALPTGSSQAVA